MNISVIIPTYNGAKKLPNLLTALEQQSYGDFEVVIVSDGSVDDTEAIVKGRKWKLDIVFLKQENKGRSATRNHGARVAKNELLVFFDDDMRPLPDCLERHHEHHIKYPGSILTGGANEEVTDASSEIFKFKAHLSDKWLDDLKQSTLVPLTKEQLFLTTQNFSISKEIFNKAGGFDEQLTDAEDYDLAVRAYKLHIPMYYNYSVFAWHDDPLTITGYIKRQRQYAAANAKLIALHPDWLKEGFLKAPYRPTGIKARVFSFFSSKGWITAMERNTFRYLPIALKYRLYDYIITANGVIHPEKVAIK